jgi:hypothetical protein
MGLWHIGGVAAGHGCAILAIGAGVRDFAEGTHEGYPYESGVCELAIRRW